MSFVALLELDPRIRVFAQAAVDQFRQITGVTPSINSVYRSTTKQAQLYRQRHLNRYPVAKPGTSAHEYRMAWDSSVPAKYQLAWNVIRRTIGWEVLPNDEIHAQVPSWRQYVRR